MALQIELDTVKWITDYGNLERSKIKRNVLSISPLPQQSVDGIYLAAFFFFFFFFLASALPLDLHASPPQHAGPPHCPVLPPAHQASLQTCQGCKVQKPLPSLPSLLLFSSPPPVLSSYPSSHWILASQSSPPSHPEARCLIPTPAPVCDSLACPQVPNQWRGPERFLAMGRHCLHSLC